MILAKSKDDFYFIKSSLTEKYFWDYSGYNTKIVRLTEQSMKN